MTRIPAGLETSPALQYVISKGWRWQGDGSGGQIQLETCPFCHKANYKFYMAVMAPEVGTRDGLYQCFHASCNATGNLRKLQESMGDRIAGVDSRKEWAGRNNKPDELPDVDACHEALMGDPEVLDYLINVRGFTEEIIKQQKLGLKEKVRFREAGEVRALVIPYLVNGNAVFVKYRTLPPSPKDFVTPSGWEVPLYNEEILSTVCDDILFVEGEADAISCLSQGISRVVGVPGANIKKASWIEKLDKAAPERIYICYDSDKAGQKGAQELASRIGIDKCLKVVLPEFIYEGHPGKDIGEWFKSGATLEDFEQLKCSAQLFDVTGVVSSVDALAQLEDELAGKEDLAPKYVTGWPSLNKLVGFEDGDVIDILAPEKIGKTTFGMNLIDHMTEAYGEDGLIVCLEMTQARLARKWVAMVTGFEDLITTPGTEESKAKLEELKEACVKARETQRMRDADLYFAYPQLVKSPEDVYKLIRDCIRRYGVKWVMFDNIQLLCDNTLGNQGHRTVHLSQISKAFAKLAKDHRIKMIRILQPKRIEEGHMISTNHTDGASQIAKDCDAMLTLWRASTGEVKKSAWEDETNVLEECNESFGPRMRVTVGLSRYSSGGSRDLFFDGARSQVREIEKIKPLFNDLITSMTVKTEGELDSVKVKEEITI